MALYREVHDEVVAELQEACERMRLILDFYYKSEGFWHEVSERERSYVAARLADLQGGRINALTRMLTNAGRNA